MKRTTYILIGMVVGLPSLIVILFFIISLFAKSNENSFFDWDISADAKKEVAIQQIKAVKIETTEFDFVHLSSDLQIVTNQEGKNTFSYAEGLEDFLDLSYEGDTLFISFHLDKSKLPGEYKNKKYGHIGGDYQLLLNISKPIEYVRNDASWLGIVLRGITSDVATIISHKKIEVVNCILKDLTISSVNSKFGVGLQIAASEIENLYFNVDESPNWQADNSQIRTAYLSGNKTHTMNLASTRFDQIVWTPDNPEAELCVKFKGNTSILINE